MFESEVGARVNGRKDETEVMRERVKRKTDRQVCVGKGCQKEEKRKNGQTEVIGENMNRKKKTKERRKEIK